ncbi:recombinase zinc beta ribbon domain-containing protein, partial [Chloroflexota bacterium]
SRNTRREYLLRGFVKCRACGRNYVGVTHISNCGVNRYQYNYYRCGATDTLSPVRCDNRRYRLDYLDQVIWDRIETVLSQPELVLEEVQKRQERSEDAGVLERNLTMVDTQLTNREKQKARVWKSFQLTGDEETFKKSIGQLQREVESLQQERLRLEGAIEGSRQFSPNANDIKRACEVVRQNLKRLSLEDKRMALEALQVMVWVDSDSVEIEGAIPVMDLSIASRSPGGPDTHKRKGCARAMHCT